MISSRIFAVGKWHIAVLVALSIVVLFGMAACANERPRQIPQAPITPDLTVSGPSLDKSTAVKLVQQYVARSGGSVMVQVPYWETKKRKVTCYGDPQFEGCDDDPFSPTGYSKDKTERERQCCRSERRSIPSQASWEAVYQASSDDWGVQVEFLLDGVKQLIKWIVDDDSREVSDSR